MTTRRRAGAAGDTQPPVEVLRGYALVADGERGALIGPRGELSWLCAPQWHDDAVFSALIGGRGDFLLSPRDDRYVWGGYYEDASLVWHGRWVTGDAIIETREALAMPADRHRVVLLRRVIGRRGAARVRMVLDARAGFGRHGMRQLRRADDGTWYARTGALWLRLRGAPDAVVDESGRLAADVDIPQGQHHDIPGRDRRRHEGAADVDIPQGQHHDLVLELADRSLPEPEDPDALWERTAHVWSTLVPDLAGCAAPRDARLACALLRGMTSSSGGMVAAATMSLPERSDQRRNYDYRYVWLRDLCYAGTAAAAAGMVPLLAELVDFAVGRVLTDGERLRPASLVGGGRVPDERTLSLLGYPGGQDVAGNWVNEQFQLDTVGELLQLFTVAARHDCLDAEGWRALRIALDLVATRWRKPDAGIWELEDDWWTHSRLACVAGLRSAATVQSAHDASQLVALADQILAETGRRCRHPDGRWQRSPTLAGTDAALVLPPARGALPGDDPRTRATLQAVVRDLSDDYYAYRYAHDGQELGEAEGAFLLCGFMICLAELQQGNRVGAYRWFERNRAACGSPGLFTEEYDVRQRQLRGNLPQAFVHAGLLETAIRLAE